MRGGRGEAGEEPRPSRSGPPVPGAGPSVPSGREAPGRGARGREERAFKLRRHGAVA